MEVGGSGGSLGPILGVVLLELGRGLGVDRCNSLYDSLLAAY